MKSLSKFTLIIALFSAGCSMRVKEPLDLKKAVTNVFILTPPIYKSQDTTRKLTDAQKKVILDRYYQYNYEKYFSPEFIKLRSIIDKQARSIDFLTTYLQVSRHRSDSIAKERNYYRTISDAKDTSYQNKVIALQKLLIDQQKKANQQSIQADISNKKQINFNTVVAMTCLIGLLVMIGVITGMYYRINALYKTFVKHA